VLTPRRKALSAYAIVFLLALLVLSCELEDEIRINPDGSGTYRTKLLVEKQLASALPEVRKEAEKNGFRIVEEGETDTRRFIVMERDFKSVSEVGDERNRMAFTATKHGWFRQRYEFTASLPSSSSDGFSRQLTLTLPGSIQQSTGGVIRGNTVVWDASKGGSLQVTSIGLAPSASRWLTIIAVLGVVLLAIVLVVSKWNRKAPEAVAPAAEGG
jgi:hypothetical protein